MAKFYHTRACSQCGKHRAYQSIWHCKGLSKLRSSVSKGPAHSCKSHGYSACGMQVWTGREQGDAFVGWLSTQLPSALAQSRLPKLLQVKWPSTNCSTAFPEPPRHLAHHKPASAKTLSMKKGSLTEIWSFSALKVELLACCQLKNAVYSNSKHALSLPSCNLPAQNWWPYWLAYTVPLCLRS